MKRVTLFACLICGVAMAHPNVRRVEAKVNPEVEQPPKCGQKFTVSPRTYRLSKCFELHSDQLDPVTIWKRRVDMRRHYDLYDSGGDWEAEGICRILSLGLFYDWATEIDVYDRCGQRIGYIDGQLATTALAKFSIYDAENQRVGIAYLDDSQTSISVYHPEHSAQVVAALQRVMVPRAPDYWEVELHLPEQMDLRILQILAAWAVDRQDDFLKDT